MTTHSIIAIVLNILSLLFLAIALKRIANYSRQITLEENRYTLMFGCIDLKLWLYLYAFFVILFGGILFFVTI